uniref:ATP synthase subunit a n=1 Tax=Craugastor augusti TaxID=228429 RepID=S4V007_9NEOB|nr:ATP synthase F0 subunit 6 [Craugastor augusti]
MTMNLFTQFMSPTLMGVPLVLIALLVPWLFLPTPKNRWLNNRLISIQSFFMGKFVKDLLLPLNPTGHKWAMMFLSLTIFLVYMNTLGLLPYTFTPTAQLSLTLGLAVPMWLATVVIGFRIQFSHTVAHFLPMSTPGPLIPILILVETISFIIRPLALAVRLAANLTAGHLLIYLISAAVLALNSVTLSALAFLTLLLLTLLEIAVALIQAYVFVLLLSIYLQEST